MSHTKFPVAWGLSRGKRFSEAPKEKETDRPYLAYLSKHTYKFSSLSTRSSARMKLVHVALLYLGSATFFGVDAARVDVATEFKRK